MRASAFSMSAAGGFFELVQSEDEEFIDNSQSLSLHINSACNNEPTQQLALHYKTSTGAFMTVQPCETECARFMSFLK